MEDAFRPDNFANMNKKFFESYNLKTGQKISTSKEAGKIVNNFEDYIVVFLDSEEAKNAKIGDTLTLRLSDIEDIPVEISYLKEDDGECMIVFKTNKAVEELISYRKITVDVIWWSYEGLKVPNTAIIEENGINYVIRNRVGYNDKIPVKITHKNKNYSIVQKYTLDELRELGYKEEDLLSVKSISQYDEIVVDPNS